jgi:hypothetical protein
MQLGWSHKRRLVRDGYVLLRGAVPAERVAAALRAINRSLGQEGMARDRLPEMRARTYCPELVAADDIVDLYRATDVRRAAEDLIGRVRDPGQAQIALRFPEAGPPGSPTPHIDGMYTPENGVPAGTLYHFTALAGVFLSDVPAPDAGNFTVWPGSHQHLAAHFRERGVESLLDGLPRIPLGAPKPVLAHAGDAVLANYALAHAAAANVSPHVRYAVFFRLFHQDHESVGTRSLTDPWLEWEGLRE